MTTRQRQNASEGAVAIQATGDVVVHQGVSAEEMAEIMVKLGTQLAYFQNEAMDKVEERLGKFRDEMLTTFSNPEKADPEAFKDPGFQFALKDAQIAYAKSGDEELKSILIDMIARRSKEKGRNRLTITLDEAAAHAARLTSEEFSILTLSYIIRYTVNHGVNTLQSLANYLAKNVMPFVMDPFPGDAAFMHIEATSCGSLSIGEVDMRGALIGNYGGVLGMGFDRAKLEEHLPDGKKNALDGFIIPCINNSTLLQPNGVRRDIFVKNATRGTDIDPTTIHSVWNAFENTIPEDIVALISPHLPHAHRLFAIWKDASIKSLELNTLGIAIAHANAVRVVGWKAPLSIWIP